MSTGSTRPPLYDRLFGVPLERGTVTVATIRHDAWCPALKTQVTADCRCEPEIEYRRVGSPRRPGE